MAVVYLMFYVIACVEWASLQTPWFLNLYLFAVNVVSLAVFVIDKGRAERGEWRIPEVRLHLLTLAGGALGSGAAMVLVRHKIRKIQFRLMYWVGLFIFCVAVGALRTPTRPANKPVGASAIHKARTAYRHRKQEHPDGAANVGQQANPF